MSTGPTEQALEAHLHRRADALAVPPTTDAGDAIEHRSSRLRRRRRAQRAGLASAALVIVGAAGGLVLLPSDGSDVNTVPADSSTTAPTTDEESGVDTVPPLPLDLFNDPDASGVLQQANDTLVARCMAAAGHAGDAYPTSDTEGSPPPPRPRHEYGLALYGVTSEADVRERGYRPLQWTVEVAASRADGGEAPTVTEQFGAEVLAAANGCQAEVGALLRGGPDQDMASPNHPANAVGELGGEATARTQVDPRVRTAVAAWSACMTGKGYQYASPLDPGRQFSQGLVVGQPVVPSEIEVATALDDVACKAAVGFDDTWFAVLAEHQQALIDANPDTIDEWAAWNAAMHSRAEAVIDDDTGTGPS